MKVLEAETETASGGELMFSEEDESLDWGMPSEKDDTSEESLREPQGTMAAEHAQTGDDFRAVAQGDVGSKSAKSSGLMTFSTPHRKKGCA